MGFKYDVFKDPYEGFTPNKRGKYFYPAVFSDLSEKGFQAFSSNDLFLKERVDVLLPLRGQYATLKKKIETLEGQVGTLLKLLEDIRTIAALKKQVGLLTEMLPLLDRVFREVYQNADVSKDLDTKTRTLFRKLCSQLKKPFHLSE